MAGNDQVTIDKCSMHTAVGSNDQSFKNTIIDTSISLQKTNENMACRCDNSDANLKGRRVERWK